MGYNIVTNLRVISELKKSRYFKVNLGIANTTEKNGQKVLNNKDTFAYFYNTTYKTTIFAQGNIGDIRFYIDHYIKDDVIAFYYNEEEFILDFDHKMVKEKGVDFLLGHIIKKIETEYEDRIKESELKKSDPVKEGDGDKIFTNPGSMTYADLKAYMDKQNSMRYSIQNNNKNGTTKSDND